MPYAFSPSPSEPTDDNRQRNEQSYESEHEQWAQPYPLMPYIGFHDSRFLANLNDATLRSRVDTLRKFGQPIYKDCVKSPASCGPKDCSVPGRIL